MTLPKNNPTNFCRSFIERELHSFKPDKAYISYWPTMERLIECADDLKLPFQEIINAFGYSDVYDAKTPQSTELWLTLEHIWFSLDFRKKDIVKARNDLKELRDLTDDIVVLALKLATKLDWRLELYQSSGFFNLQHQSIDELFDLASEHKYLFQSHVFEKMKLLTDGYDMRYWPTISDLIRAIANFEEIQPNLKHSQYPDDVINGRESDIKDFVLAFDSRFDERNSLPTGFRFSHTAMADIINVILDLPMNSIATSDAVRNVRHRYQ